MSITQETLDEWKDIYSKPDEANKWSAKTVLSLIAEVELLTADRDALREVVEKTKEALGESEINPNNYNHEEVVELNTRSTDAYLILEAALASKGGGQ